MSEFIQQWAWVCPAGIVAAIVFGILGYGLFGVATDPEDLRE